jgi:hypothetical protein
MRLGGSIGPRLLRLSWTYWRSRPRPRGRVYHGTLRDSQGRIYWKCPHDHRRPDTADACAVREQNHRANTGRRS